MSVYVDASALTAIFVREPGWQGIAEWLAMQDGALVYSNFGFGEFRSALGNRVRRREASADYAIGLVATARSYLAPWTLVDITSPDIADASDLLERFDLGLRLPDAIHIAVARRLGLRLVSTDVRQVFAARAFGVESLDPSKVSSE